MRERHPTTNYPGSCPRIGLWQATIRDELRDASTRVEGGGEGGRTALRTLLFLDFLGEERLRVVERVSLIFEELDLDPG
jgi:hypothetical protein